MYRRIDRRRCHIPAPDRRRLLGFPVEGRVDLRVVEERPVLLLVRPQPWRSQGERERGGQRDRRCARAARKREAEQNRQRERGELETDDQEERYRYSDGDRGAQ